MVAIASFLRVRAMDLSVPLVDVPTCVVLFCIYHYASLNGIYFSLEYHGVEPSTEGVPLLKNIYTSQHQCLYWS